MSDKQLTLFAPVPITVDTAALDRCTVAPVVAIDCETETTWNGTGPEDDFGLSYPAPVTHISLAWGTESLVLQAPFDDQVKAALTTLFEKRQVVFHNAVFDVRQLAKLTGGNAPENPWCTLTLARLLKPELGSFSLLAVAYAFGVPFPDWLKAMKDKRASLSTLDADKVVEYAAWDAKLTLAIYQAQQVSIVDEKVYDLVDWENRAVAAYCRMAAGGINLNRPYVEQRIAELTATIEAAGKRLMADGLHRPNSPQARVKYIYETKGIPKPPKEEGSGFYTPHGGLSTSADVIEALAEYYPEHADKLADLRAYLLADRTRATLQALQDHAALDGRIHSLVSVATATGRRASSQPNIQNLKMEPGDPMNLCGVLTADEGCTLVEIDYSNAENWMAALLAGDSALAAACSAKDFHSAMAEIYFGDKWRATENDKDARKHLRFLGKRITFGTAYGMGAKKLARSLAIPEAEAYALLEAKDRAFPAVALAKKHAGRKASGEGYINLWTGRKVPVPSEQLYVAWNYLCQGGVGELLKRSIVLIDEAFREKEFKSRVGHDMHDAIVLEVAHSEWDAAITLASEIMRTIIPDSLNQRTDPPIQWIAKPDLAENARKWGKGQWHPEVPSVEACPPIPVKQPVLRKRAVYIEFVDIGWQGMLIYHNGQLTRESAMTYFTELKAAIQVALNGPYAIAFPGKGQIKVNLENYIKVQQVWLANVDKVELPTELGDADWLASNMADQQTWLAQLQGRLMNAEKWLKEFAA